MTSRWSQQHIALSKPYPSKLFPWGNSGHKVYSNNRWGDKKPLIAQVQLAGQLVNRWSCPLMTFSNDHILYTHNEVPYIHYSAKKSTLFYLFGDVYFFLHVLIFLDSHWVLTITLVQVAVTYFYLFMHVLIQLLFGSTRQTQFL